MPLSRKDIIRIIGKAVPETLEEHVQLVEYRMGMSVDDFHKKIQEVVTPEYIAEGERKYKILQDWINNKRSITTQKKKKEERQELILSENEYFVPCFHPDEPFRNEMPNHWFISNKSNLITVIGRTVYWIKPHPYDRGLRSSYKLKKSPITGKKSSVTAHNLLWAVFNRDCIFGRAGDYINRFGTFAFGVKNDPFNVEGHHKERIEDYPEKVNDPFDIQVMTVFAHEVLRKIRHVQDEIQKETSEEKKVSLRNELLRLVSKLSDIEAPGKSVVVNNGERYDKDGNFKDNKGIYDYSDVQPNDILWSPFALQTITLLRHGDNVHKQIRKAVEIIGIEEFTEEQIIVIQYQDETPLSFTVKKANDSKVDIKLVPENEIEGKEVYIFEVNDAITS